MLQFTNCYHFQSEPRSNVFMLLVTFLQHNLQNYSNPLQLNSYFKITSEFVIVIQIFFYILCHNIIPKEFQFVQEKYYKFLLSTVLQNCANVPCFTKGSEKLLLNIPKGKRNHSFQSKWNQRNLHFRIPTLPLYSKWNVLSVSSIEIKT